jgi:hypothetical protein
MSVNLASADKAESPFVIGCRQHLIRRAPDKELSGKKAGK